MKRVQSYGKHEDIVLRTHIELSRSLIKIRAKEIIWLAERDLTLPQFGILESLYHLGKLSVGQITKLTLSTPGNMTVIVKNLQSKGLIRILTSDEDRRIKMLEITDEGSEIIKSIFPAHVENLTGWYDKALDEEELQTLSRLLRKLEKAQ
ncbi:MAG: MarR family transcriptional regulator [Sulfuricurvum sp.]|uniref:MarR family winged helix-turn-helix transcriptional regulator n=1 Tax=Sulfuricurvum sp. TaxID=2025608 RepID=UPI00263056DC|nr:MarR family transcriptional regulator [Sulfuricurvum sp.]MDD2370024.1 MarR family transcriptional regulator [Sulfuricurvum sp.]MDD2949730.1 MarR family transcriptional regulator [Sulfuricurvum sp.]MDD5118822.1 MarR family transcriptional regulator [Sulfuricurvum sp.]